MSRLLDIQARDWCWILALAFWRLIVASRFTLGPDEAHYALYGMHLDWSYLDHPPLVGWVEALFLRLLGVRETIVRLPAILCGITASVLCWKVCFRITRSEEAARWGTVALNASFVPAALFIMFLPDTLLLLGYLAIALIILQIDATKAIPYKTVFATAVLIGFCGLSKYTAFLLPISLIAFAHKKKIHLNRWAWATLTALPFLMLLPVLIWNSNHDWISFKYQINHVLGHSWHFASFLIFIGGQLAAYNLFIIAAALLGWLAATRKGTPFLLGPKGTAYLFLPIFGFFAYAALRQEVLLHWTMAGWGLALPVGVAMAHQSSWRTWTKRLVIAGALAAAFLQAELTFQFLRYPNGRSPYQDFVGWMELHNEIAKLKSRLPEFAIGVTNWTQASRAGFYLQDLAPVYVLDDRFDQFDLWENGPPKNKNLLIIEWSGFDLLPAKKSQCETLTDLRRMTFIRHGRRVNSLHLLWCENYKP